MAEAVGEMQRYCYRCCARSIVHIVVLMRGHNCVLVYTCRRCQRAYSAHAARCVPLRCTFT